MSELAKKLLAKSAFVGWPYLVEAKIHSLSDGKNLYMVSLYMYVCVYVCVCVCVDMVDGCVN